MTHDAKIALIAFGILIGGTGAWLGAVWGLVRLFDSDWKAGQRSWMANKSAIDPATGQPWLEQRDVVDAAQVHNLE